MEAVLASDECDKDAAARARMNSVYDSLNRLESGSFFIGMNIQDALETQPPARRMRSFLATQLESLNPDEIASVYESEGISAVPKWSFEHEGWKIEFFPIPKSQEARGEPGVRPLGFWQYGPYWSTSRVAIRDAIVSKSGRYGALDRPFIIAVNALSGGVDWEDEFFALFGDEQWNVTKSSSGETTVEPKTRPNGAWTSAAGPRNSDGNPNSPQTVVFITSIIDEIAGVST